MTIIRAVVNDRIITVPAPSDLPDGTEVLLTIGRNIPVHFGEARHGLILRQDY